MSREGIDSGAFEEKIKRVVDDADITIVLRKSSGRNETRDRKPREEKK